MNPIILVAAGALVLASTGDASATASQKPGYHRHRGALIQWDVGLGDGFRPPLGIPANPDLKYGPQLYYPQSPFGGS
jgi:hypothetical protein